jgi:hypothetical protein
MLYALCQVDAYETFGLRTERTIKNSLSCFTIGTRSCLTELQYQQKASESNGILIPTQQPREILYGIFPQTCHESHQISTDILRKVCDHQNYDNAYKTRFRNENFTKSSLGT